MELSELSDAEVIAAFEYLISEDDSPNEPPHLRIVRARLRETFAVAQDPDETERRAALRTALTRVMGVGGTALLQSRLSVRDRYISEAVRQMRLGPEAFAARWESFVGRQWDAWKDYGDPPADVDPGYRALFFATLHNQGKALSASSLRNLRRLSKVGGWKLQG